jgi:hypothetical protein
VIYNRVFETPRFHIYIEQFSLIHKRSDALYPLICCFDRSLIKLSLTRHWQFNNSPGVVVRSLLSMIKRLFFGELRTPQSPSVIASQFPPYCGATALSFAVYSSHNYTYTR